MKGLILSILLAATAGCAVNKPNKPLAPTTALQPYNYVIKKKTDGSNGAVVSAHTLASEVGLNVLKSGGNAIDAAIATQLALAVVYPGAGNIGGGGFLVGSLKGGKNIAIDFREKAPAKASRNMYLDSNGNIIDGLSTTGSLAAGIPGTVAGLFASMKYASFDFPRLIQPAIDLALGGFTVTAAEAEGLNAMRNEFLKNNSVIPAFVKDRSWKAGDTLVQKDLANTLTRIRDHGQNGFYQGETADRIVEEMKKGKGLISYADLKNYRAKTRNPVIFGYKGYTIVTMPLPSSGGIILRQLMKMVEDQPLRQYGFQSWQAVQLMTEAERRAYADRSAYMGDADFYKAPVKMLMSDKYILGRMKDYDPAKAGKSKQIKPGNIPESEETTHLSVYDKYGNAISVTTTLNGSYGCGTVVGGAGFLLNNEMDDFSAKPGTQNMYGAIGGEANAIQPGKRMLSSMTPTIVLKNKTPFLVLGTPGGTTIPTSVFQTLVNIIEFDLSVEDAVNKPKFHHQWIPDEVYTEPLFSAGTIKKMEQMGYTMVSRSGIGRTEVIKIQPNGQIEAVADKRGDDHAAGF